jgi:4-hydroxy-3-polyprenylbenzoate decarboxylase
MEQARGLWERLGLPPLSPETPWFGYSLGEWTEDWDQAAARATRGEWAVNAAEAARRRRSDQEPNATVSRDRVD